MMNLRFDSGWAKIGLEWQSGATAEAMTKSGIHRGHNCPWSIAI